MSIAPVQHIAVIGRIADKPILLEGLQDLGCIHITPVSTSDQLNTLNDALSGPADDTTTADIDKALKFLNDAPFQRRQVIAQHDFSIDETIAAVLDIKRRLRVANDKRDYLLARIADVEAWGEITFPEKEPQAGLRFWFYLLPRRAKGQLKQITDPWVVVATDDRSSYVVVLAENEPSPDLLPTPRVHIGSEPLSALKAALHEAEIEIDDLVAERIAFTRFVSLISAHLTNVTNAASLRAADQASYSDADLCFVQGWTPEDDAGRVEEFAIANGLGTTCSPPAPRDAPPTLLRQSAARQSGVDLSMFYQVPDYRSWDPTLMLLISFPFFFAMILADAGYGLVLGSILALYWRRLGKTPRGRSYRLLSARIVLGTCFYGALVGSYFGVAPPDRGVLAAINILSINDFDTMMKVSIGVGVLHITIANLLSAYVLRRQPDVLSKFGWIAVCVGGYAIYAFGDDPLIRNVSSFIACIGVALIFFFSSLAQGQGFGSHIKRGLDGAQALAGAMTAFGDVLSYMRLFALGLASASLAVTFNQLAVNAQAALPGLGFLAAALIILLGHGLNLALGIISGVVHGLRLNYIEFFKWGFDDEGYAFTPFAKKQMETA
ncbi:MAG: V-type ATP synthase subunit I [Pseudomonadota bacterium]